MKTTIKAVGGLTTLCFLLAFFQVQAQSEKPIERVSLTGGKLTYVQDGKTMPLETNVIIASNIKVMTNGTFSVKNGKERKLREGQTLRADGTIGGADGSIMPVVDHVTMKNGKLTVVKDGESTAATREVILEDGSRVMLDGIIVTRDGRRMRVLDGQIFKLEGGALPAKDTVTLKDGKVVVQKDGSLFQVQPRQSVMMSDGTKVFGDGAVITKDGKRVKLAEGETLIVEGAVTKR